MINPVTTSPVRQNQPVPQQGPSLGASNVAKRAFLCLGTCLKSSCALVSRELQKGKDKYSLVLDRLKYGQENAHLIAQLNQSGIELSKENKIRFCYHSTPAFLIEPLRQLHAAHF